MPDLTRGKKFCRVSQTWLDPKEYARRYDHYEELVFLRKPSQGQLSAPMILSDTQPALMSMTNGKHYDSKSEMRKEYRRAGVTEVGNDTPKKREAPSRDERVRREKQRKGAIAGALSKAGFGAP